MNITILTYLVFKSIDIFAILLFASIIYNLLASRFSKSYDAKRIQKVTKIVVCAICAIVVITSIGLSFYSIWNDKRLENEFVSTEGYIQSVETSKHWMILQGRSADTRNIVFYMNDITYRYEVNEDQQEGETREIVITLGREGPLKQGQMISVDYNPSSGEAYKDRSNLEFIILRSIMNMVLGVLFFIVVYRTETK